MSSPQQESAANSKKAPTRFKRASLRQAPRVPERAISLKTPTMVVHPVVHQADHPRNGEQRCKFCRKVLRRPTQDDRWTYLPGALLRERSLPAERLISSGVQAVIGVDREPFKAVALKANCVPGIRRT